MTFSRALPVSIDNSGLGMCSTIDPSLGQAIAALASPGLLVGHRLISPGDETALLAEEARSIASQAVGVRRASGAARIVGRLLLGEFGIAACAIPKSVSGAPVWPAGVVGSLAHDDRVAVAAVGFSRDVTAVGIDVEPAGVLPLDLLDMVATPRERARMADDPYRGRLLFAAKEAVYKAAYPLDREILEYHDIQVDLAARQAAVRNGRVFEIRHCLSSHLVVLALA